MTEPSRFQERIRDLAVAPSPREEHRESLRAELKARQRARRRLQPALLAAAVALVFGATLLNEGVLESTGYRFNFAEVEGDTSLTLADHADAKSTMGFAMSDGKRNLPLSQQRIAEAQERLAVARRNYETGAAPLFRVNGWGYDGEEAYILHYRTYFGDEFTDYPVNTEYDIENPRYWEYITTPRYHEFMRDVSQLRAVPAAVDTMYFGDQAVLMRRWVRVDPEYGEVEISIGYPLTPR